jgi:hypothetical protein
VRSKKFTSHSNTFRIASVCCLLHYGFLLALFLDINMEATCSSESSAEFNALRSFLSQNTSVLSKYPVGREIA